jgi:hypothetical protein
MQIFVRGRQGIKNLAELVAILEEREFPFREHARVLHEIQAVLTEMRGIKKEIKSLDSILNIFSEDKKRERVRKLLHTRIDNLLAQLEQIARDKTRTYRR